MGALGAAELVAAVGDAAVAELGAAGAGPGALGPGAPGSVLAVNGAGEGVAGLRLLGGAAVAAVGSSVSHVVAAGLEAAAAGLGAGRPLVPLELAVNGAGVGVAHAGDLAGASAATVGGLADD